MRYQDLLLMRFLLLNIGLAVLAGLAWKTGLVDQALESGAAVFLAFMCALFAYGWWIVFYRLVGCTRMLNSMEKPGAGENRVKEFRDISDGRWANEVISIKLHARVMPIERIALWLKSLGYLGTIYGFMLAFGGVTSESASNIDMVGPMVAALITGMHFALWTTLCGLAGALALQWNTTLLDKGYSHLSSKLLAEGGRQQGGGP